MKAEIKALEGNKSWEDTNSDSVGEDKTIEFKCIFK